MDAQAEERPGAGLLCDAGVQGPERECDGGDGGRVGASRGRAPFLLGRIGLMHAILETSVQCDASSLVLVWRVLAGSGYTCVHAGAAAV
eukprot:2333724-Rhodomonas_salina.1